MTDVRTEYQCVQCGQTDDHPKNWGDQGPKHHDCLSYAEKEAIRQSNPAVADVIRACDDGLRGPDLLAHILTARGGK